MWQKTVKFDVFFDLPYGYQCRTSWWSCRWSRGHQRIPYQWRKAGRGSRGIGNARYQWWWPKIWNLLNHQKRSLITLSRNSDDSNSTKSKLRKFNFLPVRREAHRISRGKRRKRRWPFPARSQGRRSKVSPWCHGQFRAQRWWRKSIHAQ